MPVGVRIILAEIVPESRPSRNCPSQNHPQILPKIVQQTEPEYNVLIFFIVYHGKWVKLDRKNKNILINMVGDYLAPQ